MSEAAEWWAGRGLIRWYEKDQTWRRELAEKVVAEHPTSVLDFGCNVGRTLADVHDLDPSIKCVGVDINGAAIKRGRQLYGLDLRQVSSDYLDSLADDAFDVAYTCSVIDHIEDPAPVLANLARIAPTLLLLEPWTGAEGPAESHNPFTYSWDYPARLRALGYSVVVRRMPLSGTGLGPLYRLHTARRKP